MDVKSAIEVPFLDLRAQYACVRSEITAALEHVFDRAAFAGGVFVVDFEKDFARFSGCDFTVGVGSGTTALWVALSGLRIGPGDEVVTTPNTFIATAEAVRFCGARPVFVDIDEHTYNMNPELLEEVITSRTKAIIPVHLFGQMTDMNRIMEGKAS
jgi:dTDP-4-amino-4,6-dideoxygalactose transaminase